MKNTARMLLVVAGLALMAPAWCSAQAHSFGVENGKFVLDGKPFQVISGEMHSPRIPRAYWRARLQWPRRWG